MRKSPSPLPGWYAMGIFLLGRIGGMTVKDYICKYFADAFLTLVPDFPMDEWEIEDMVLNQGLESFLLVAEDYAEGLAEAVELLVRLGGGRR